MTQAEAETVEVFCRELALALRRITGKKIEIDPKSLPRELEEPENRATSLIQMASDYEERKRCPVR